MANNTTPNNTKARYTSPGKLPAKQSAKPPANATAAHPAKNSGPKKLSTAYQDQELKVLNRVLHDHHKLTLGQRAADKLALWAGSWTFIGGILIFIAVWMAINVVAVFVYNWDPYPFILLNLFLSCLAALQAPVILMSQNRQADRDRLKLERDHAINTKAEKEIENMQTDLDEIKKMIRKISKA